MNCFLLHPGLRGSIAAYWELWPEVWTSGSGGALAVQAGTVRKTTVLALPSLPPGWMRGRYFTWLAGTDELVEVTDQVLVDGVAGLQACPDYLRDRYRELANVRESAGELGNATPTDATCPKCKVQGQVVYQTWESSCGGYEDYKHTCKACGHVWWIDGIDS